jgi:hypothetical protein
MPSSCAVEILATVGGLGLFMGNALFIRMAIELNRVLQPQKKFYVLELRSNFHEVKRLHEESFPVSAVRTPWFVVTVLSMVIMAIAAALAVKPK